MSLSWQLTVSLSILSLVASQTTTQSCRYNQYIPPDGRIYYITSPNFPNRFVPGSSCIWYMYTDPGYTIDLSCYNVNLEQTSFGCRNSLTTYGTDGDGSYCNPFNVTSSSRKMAIALTSSIFASGGSFACVVRAPIVNNDCDCGWSFRTKIVGGVETGVNEFPMMVSLIDVRKRAHACGATIISPKHVVTAAHCLMALQPGSTGVLVGEHDLNTNIETNATALYRVRRFIYHPQWSPSLTRNDIGLIEVERPITYSMRVGPVCLPFNRPNIPQLNEALTVLGWGTVSFGGPVSNVLMKTAVRVVPIERCQASFGDRVSSDGQFCTYEPGKDSCQMDSGGPLLSANPTVSRYFLAGLVSYGGACAGDDPSVSTWVYPYVDWIRRVTGETFCVK